MRRAAAPALIVFSAIGIALPPPAASQTRSEPRLILSLFGGVAGGSNIWEINRQPLLVLGSELSPLYDTLRLSRRISPGLMLGISGTVFQTPRFGISGEMVFLGFGTDDTCALRFETPDGLRRNAQICDDISSHSGSPTTVAFSVGANFRPLPRAAVSPYVRVQAGIGARSGSVILMEGSFIEGGTRERRLILNDQSSERVSPSAGIAGGLMTTLGPGYQLRLELRDQIILMKRVAGPATILDQAIPPTETFRFHSVGLTAGLDIVLEHRRGRRY